MRYWLIALACVWGVAAPAQDWCVTPVEGGHYDTGAGGVPETCISTASYSIIPGYPKLVIARDACGLRTIQDQKLVALEAEYPVSGMWAYRDHLTTSDGRVLGFRHRPRQVYQLDRKSGEFLPLPVKDYLTASYDPHRNRLMVLYKNNGLFEWDGDQLAPSRLGGLDFDHNSVLPRFFPELSAYLAVAGKKYYYRNESDDRGWQRLRLWFSAPSDYWMLNSARTHYDPGQNLFFIQFSQDILAFETRPGGGFRYAYSVSIKGGAFHPKNGPSIAIRNSKHLKPESQERHDVVVLTRDGPVPAETYLKPLQDRPDENSVVVPDRHKRDSGYYNPPLFRLNSGWAYYDGSGFYPVPHLSRDALGNYPYWYLWEGRLFVLHTGGWAELQDDLTLKPGTLSAEFRAPHQIDVTISKTFPGILAVRRGAGIWHAEDGLTFKQVYSGPVDIWDYLSDVPNQDHGLLRGNDGLYLLEQDCR